MRRYGSDWRDRGGDAGSLARRRGGAFTLWSRAGKPLGRALDDVVATRTNEPYRMGDRAMRKVMQYRSVDCVVDCFRTEKAGDQLASLLLGLDDKDVLLKISVSAQSSRPLKNAPEPPGARRASRRRVQRQPSFETQPPPRQAPQPMPPRAA
ncbi:hypothetical protein GCM10022281_07450 [Sphingomonas rosea]|uniref:Uncharacterized protein n=1 Tax=Sphingomonas rosea TaxID=335605 RepID=A0ABP7TSD2_9SPHN